MTDQLAFALLELGLHSGCPPSSWELTYIQKEENITLEHLRVLLRLINPASFPLNMIVDVGVRSFKVRLEDDRIPVIHSKVVHGLSSIVSDHKVPATIPSSLDVIHHTSTLHSVFD